MLANLPACIMHTCIVMQLGKLSGVIITIIDIITIYTYYMYVNATNCLSIHTILTVNAQVV